MKILVDIIHPAHVHFFRNAIKIWQSKGHHIAITTRQKDVTIELLENYGLKYTCLSTAAKGSLNLLKELVSRDIKLCNYCKKFKPDVLTGISGYFISHVGKLINKPSIIFDDTEHQTKGHKITWPFATEIHSPDCYLKNPIAKQKLYKGFHELAYLGPNYFTPDKNIVRSLKIDPDQKYCIVRMVSWQAHHDVGQSGFDCSKMTEFLDKLSKYANPYLSVEGNCPESLKQYQLSIPAHQIHHVMAFASLCIGEGATMISESAVLGVPAVYINTLKLGYIDMLENYGLVKQTVETDKALDFGIEFLTEQNASKKNQNLKNKLIAEKIDVTEYIIENIEKFKS